MSKIYWVVGILLFHALGAHCDDKPCFLEKYDICVGKLERRAVKICGEQSGAFGIANGIPAKDCNSYESVMEVFGKSYTAEIDQCAKDAQKFCDSEVAPVTTVGSGKAGPPPPPAPRAGGGAAPAAAQIPPPGSSPSSPSSPSSSTPSISPTATDDVSFANSEASAAISSCTNAESEATRCCANPMSCASAGAQMQYAQQQNNINSQLNRPPPTPGQQNQQGLNDYCAQMAQLGRQGGDVNINMGGICSANQMSCTTTCNSLARTYQAKVSSCGSCGALAVYQRTLSQLQSMASSCDSLSAQAAQWSSQGIGGTAGSQANGNICNNMTRYNPQNANQQAANQVKPAASQSAACLANPGSQQCLACQQNPSAPGCQPSLGGSANNNGPGGSVGFAEPGRKSGDGFNLPDMADTGQYAALNAGLDTKTDGSGLQVNRPANNSGGAIPGQDSGSGAKLDAANKPRVAPQSAGSVADIMQGNRSGGYSQGQNVPTNDNQFGGSAGRLGRGLASVGAAKPNGYLGMDLKKYLPGGVYDPRTAGLSASAEINGKGADLFKKISNKFEEKCRLGILWECR